VILINVLAIVAVAVAAVMLMLGTEDPALDRAIRLREGSQALAIARGGELSAIAAQRRDMVDAPATDNRTEAWTKVAQAKTPVPGGSFTLTIADAQGRFNVNAAGAGSEPVLAAIAAALRLDPDIASRIATSIAERGRVSGLGELVRAGIDPATIARLRPMVTALPGKADVNVNAADADLLGVLVGDRVGGRLLADRRDRAGLLTPADFAATGFALPAGAGFTSDHYVVTTTVTIGGTTQVLTSLLERRAGKVPVVAAIARWRGVAPAP
jgi:general secretion pathway protein K